MGSADYFSIPAQPGRSAKKLLRAAVLAAKDKGDPPPLLWKRWRCRDWGIPPRWAGLDDQDYAEIHTMDTLEAVYNAVRSWRLAAQRPLSDGERKVIRWLAQIGAM